MAGVDPEVFPRLRAVLAAHVDGLVVQRDEPGDYRLDTPFTRSDGYVFAFGAVQTKARYVSYHLFPIYLSPGLVDPYSPLARRKHGKSCFNFTRLDDDIVAELDQLTGRAARQAADRRFFPE